MNSGTVPIKRVARVRYGLGQPPASVADGVPIIRATNIERGKIVGRDLVFASMDDLPLDRAPLLSEGEILVVRSGAYTGDSALVTPRWVGAAPGYDLRLTPVEIRPRFLAYCLLSTRVQDQITIARDRAAQPHLNAEDLGEVDVPRWSAGSQDAIADYLDAETSRIEDLIAKKRRMIEVLEERWRSTMAAGVTGELLGLPASSRPRIQWLPATPTGWERAKLNLVARLGSGHTPSRQHPEWWEDATIPWITTGEVSQVRDDRREHLTETREKISAIGLANSAAELHPADTVVLCRTASAGYSAIMGMDMATSQDFATWTCGPLLRPRFLLLCLRVMRQDLLGRLAMGSTHKTIYMPDIESIVIPLPSVEVQDVVVEAVYSRLPAIDASIDLLTRQIDLLVEHRQALIAAAVTGEIDIPGTAA